MANTQLFQSKAQRATAATAQNRAGGQAHALSAREALAQYAATACMNGSFYANAQTQLDELLALCEQCSDQYVARVAIYSRQRALLKDVPAVLTAWLACRQSSVLEEVFAQCIDNGRMLRNFVQIMRSGATGRTSLGSRSKRLVQNWLNQASDAQLIRAMVGQSPSLADVIRMVHPKPASEQRANLYRYLLGRAFDLERLPKSLQAFEGFKNGQRSQTPDVPFQMLSSLSLKRSHWQGIAKQAGWQMTRMNLNTFARHDVYRSSRLTDQICARLSDRELIRRSKAFPYQLMCAHLNCHEQVPGKVRASLRTALQHALDNVPSIRGRVLVFTDVSGSMQAPISGYRQTVSSQVRCVDVAALFSAAILRRNPGARVIAFDTRVHSVRFSSSQSVMANAERLASLGGLGTHCALPMAHAVRKKLKAELVVYVSDNESWADVQGGRQTETMQHWDRFKRINPAAKMVCIDIAPGLTSQVSGRADILNIGGFSDQVFTVLQQFVESRAASDYWTRQIEQIRIGSEGQVA